jgi:CBS domain containing-hemolysin-like protein
MDDPKISFIVMIFTLVAAAFFAGMEMAFITANRLKIELDKNSGRFSGKILSRFVSHPESFIATMLLGSNAAIVMFGVCMGYLIEQPLQDYFHNAGIVMVIQTLFSTILVLVVAEFLPKTLFQINPNRALRYGAVPLISLYWLLYLPTAFVVAISNGFLRIMKINIEKSNTAFSKIDLDHFVRDINERMKVESELTNEMQILQNALDFSKVKARDCMVPRTEIMALELQDSIEELRKKFIETGYTKILIYETNIDNIIGYVHSFELFKKPKDIKKILLPISVVPEVMPGKELLELFTTQSGNIAVVVDEFGGTSGVITIEDLMEEIFGDIEDEHDVEELIEEQLDDQNFIFSARQEIDYLNDHYHLQLPESDDYDTLSGLILFKLETIPDNGTVLEIGNYILEIQEVSDRRIELIRLTIKQD